MAALGVCMLTSVWLTNLVWVLMAANWVAEWNWREKLNNARQSRLLHLFLAIYMLYTLSLIWTSNLPEGLHVLQVKLPMLVIPLVMLTSPSIEGVARRNILTIYVLAVIVVSVVSVIRLSTLPSMNYREAVPFMSHIRFALNCCMAICLSLYAFAQSDSWIQKTFSIIVVIWLAIFLLLIRSLTSVGILLVVSTIFVVYYSKKAMSVRRRICLYTVWIALFGGIAALVLTAVNDYYKLKPIATSSLKETTISGNKYEHAYDGLIESGNYVNNYVCRIELEQEWSKRSTVGIDESIPNGYTVYPTLVRYLNAIGETKDSSGISHLTTEQIKEIEQGIANPVYIHGTAIQRMVSTALFEYESHRRTNRVRDFSMIERTELWKATVQVIKKHAIIGVGCGDEVDEMHTELRNIGSEISDTGKTTHNQYLTLLASLGILGAAVVLLFIFRALLGARKQPIWIVAWAVIVAMSCLTEDTTITLAGITFCTFFLAFIEKQCTDTTHLTTE
ncbi:MAG: O-antigen ligase family protein [Bacteroidales bacterium]|nr:O-antigen ligase family protein [Bacteroidales bacterium]